MTALLIIAATIVVAMASVAVVTKRRADSLSVEIQQGLADLRRRRMDYFGEGYLDIYRGHDGGAATKVAE